MKYFISHITKLTHSPGLYDVGNACIVCMLLDHTVHMFVCMYVCKVT